MLSLYQFLSRTIAPKILSLVLKTRIKKGKEVSERILERKGITTLQRPEGPLLWVHAASVGESQLALNIIKQISMIHPGINFLITTVTVTSAQLVNRQLPSNTVHQFVPYDIPQWLHSFLDHWRPSLAIWTESELWPNTFEALHIKKIPILLVNARMSDKSFKRWKLAKSFIQPVMALIDLCLVQSPEQEKRFNSLGAKQIKTTGNLKFSAPPLAFDSDELQALKKAIHKRPCWVAASTHHGEEGFIVEAHRLIKKSFPDLLTILIPRHPERGKEIEKYCVSQNVTTDLRSDHKIPSRQKDLFIVDTLGEIGLFYRLADIIFVGGSLVNVGGHNAIEAARLDSAILHGPHMHNFKEVTALFLDAQASLEVRDGATLAATVVSLLKNETLRNSLKRKAKTVAIAEDQSMIKALKFISPYIKALKG